LHASGLETSAQKHRRTNQVEPHPADARNRSLSRRGDALQPWQVLEQILFWIKFHVPGTIAKTKQTCPQIFRGDAMASLSNVTMDAPLASWERIRQDISVMANPARPKPTDVCFRKRRRVVTYLFMLMP